MRPRRLFVPRGILHQKIKEVRFFSPSRRDVRPKDSGRDGQRGHLEHRHPCTKQTYLHGSARSEERATRQPHQRSRKYKQ